MPILVEKFFVVRCPVCKNRIDFQGEGGFTVMETKKQALEWLSESTGLRSGTWTTGQIIVAACQGKECELTYRHRNCEKKPCGMCKAKRRANAANSKACRLSTDLG